MRWRRPTIVAAIVASGCASAGQGDGSDRITVAVVNQYPSVVTAYVIWNGNRTRLGEVSPKQTRSFSTPRRGDRVALGLEVFSTPPPATGAGPSVMSGGSTPRVRAPIAQSEAILVGPDEGIEFHLTQYGSLMFRNLPD